MDDFHSTRATTDKIDVNIVECNFIMYMAKYTNAYTHNGKLLCEVLCEVFCSVV